MANEAFIQTIYCVGPNETAKAVQRNNSIHYLKKMTGKAIAAFVAKIIGMALHRMNNESIVQFLQLGNSSRYRVAH